MKERLQVVQGDPTLWSRYYCRDSHHTSLGLEAEARGACWEHIYKELSKITSQT